MTVGALVNVGIGAQQGEHVPPVIAGHIRHASAASWDRPPGPLHLVPLLSQRDV